MKFKKKDIDKLINILQSKKEELKEFDDNTWFEITDKSNNKIIWNEPIRWVLKPAIDDREAKILSNYIIKKYKQTQWDIQTCKGHCLHIEESKYIYGQTSPQRNFHLITFEEFEKYIINK